MQLLYDHDKGASMTGLTHERVSLAGDRIEVVGQDGDGTARISRECHVGDLGSLRTFSRVVGKSII